METCKVYQATDKDFTGIYSLLVEMSENTGLKFPTPNWVKIEDLLRNLLSEGVVFVAKVNDEAVGVIGLQKGSYWWSDEEFLSDAFFYVSKEFRKSRAALLLLERAKTCAKIMGLPICGAIMTGFEPERKDKLYEHSGFKYLGGIWAIGLTGE